jgi:hypothetical protein
MRNKRTKKTHAGALLPAMSRVAAPVRVKTCKAAKHHQHNCVHV